MSPGVLRARTIHVLRRRREQFGDFHPATFAAFARAHVAWKGRVRPPAFYALPPALRGAVCHAYTTADLRARGVLGHGNRRERRYQEEKRARKTYAQAA